MAERVAIVTGVTGALGGGTAAALARSGFHVVGVGRDEARTTERTSAISRATGAEMASAVADLGDPDQVRTLAGQLLGQHPRVDLLVHTAAVYVARWEVVGRGWERMMATNHLGPFLLTDLLLPAIRTARGRVLTVSAPSTTLPDLDDPFAERAWSALWQFGRTKAANLLFVRELARREPAIAAHAVHPGLVRSDLMAQAPAPIRWVTRLASSAPGRAADGLAWLATASDLAPPTGGFWHAARRKPLAFPRPVTDDDLARRWWELSERLVGG
jgi:NAD(P)-dependent dehydrogenase (short-subunit alcohol dehydrogenase family)